MHEAAPSPSCRSIRRFGVSRCVPRGVVLRRRLQSQVCQGWKWPSGEPWTRPSRSGRTVTPSNSFGRLIQNTNRTRWKHGGLAELAFHLDPPLFPVRAARCFPSDSDSEGTLLSDPFQRRERREKRRTLSAHRPSPRSATHRPPRHDPSGTASSDCRETARVVPGGSMGRHIWQTLRECLGWEMDVYYRKP